MNDITSTFKPLIILGKEYYRSYENVYVVKTEFITARIFCADLTLLNIDKHIILSLWNYFKDWFYNWQESDITLSRNQDTW